MYSVQKSQKKEICSERTRLIIGIVEETKGYRVNLPKNNAVVVSQHVQNIETLNKIQNKQVQEFYICRLILLQKIMTPRETISRGNKFKISRSARGDESSGPKTEDKEKDSSTRNKKVVTRSARYRHYTEEA